MMSFEAISSPGLTLRLKMSPDETLDASEIQPSRWVNFSLADIAAVRLAGLRSEYRLDEFFEIIGDPSDVVVIHGDCGRFQRLGAGLHAGHLTIMGNAGNECAAQLSGGRVEVFGDVGDRLGMAMKRGTVTIHGSAGDYALGPSIGSTRGMSGGDCYILGGIGDRAAERMRRGTLFVAGDAGDYGAVQMIAGTIIVLGKLGIHWAQGMRRGTLILGEEQPKAFDASLTSSRYFELSFLPLLWKHLKSQLNDATVRLPESRWAYRQVGDRANSGTGEVLTLHRH
jgi:formylmethanofuran dehydrogenase subunit C